MQQNLSKNERLISLALGSLAASQTLLGKRGPTANLLGAVAGASLLWRGLSGYCPVTAKIKDQRQPLEAAPHMLEKSILVNKSLDQVREIISTSSPDADSILYAIDPIEAGGRLWNLHLSKAPDHKRTLIKAALSQQTTEGEQQTPVTGLHATALRQSLDAELRKIKSLLETGEIATIEGQSSGKRSMLGTSIEKITHSLEKKLHQAVPNQEHILPNSHDMRTGAAL